VPLVAEILVVFWPGLRHFLFPSMESGNSPPLITLLSFYQLIYYLTILVVFLAMLISSYFTISIRTRGLSTIYLVRTSSEKNHQSINTFDDDIYSLGTLDSYFNSPTTGHPTNAGSIEIMDSDEEIVN